VNLNGTRIARVIAVTSGKGGAGKTNVSVNLSVALARLGRRTMLADCDVGLANANILLGVESDFSIADLASRQRNMSEVTRRGPAGMMLVPGHSGVGMGGGLADDARSELAAAFRPYAEDVDDVIVDTGGGMAGEGLSLIASSDLIILVLANEPTAFVDAYALVKALALRHRCSRFAIITNRVAHDADGAALFKRFEAIVEQFLPVHLDHLGLDPRGRLSARRGVRQALLRRGFPLRLRPGRLRPARAAAGRARRADHAGRAFVLRSGGAPWR
jgi:flagellar biosynthesis protein FlhG